MHLQTTWLRSRAPHQNRGLEFDSSYLLAHTSAPVGSLHVLVDIGTEDNFLKKGQLEPEALKEAAKTAGREAGEVEIRMQDGFNHSYYFVSHLPSNTELMMKRQISTFAPEHVKWHAQYLKA